MPPDQDPLGFARDLLEFLDASPTPYHAVAEVSARLGREGFVALDPRDHWDLSPGTAAYVAEGGTLIAFILGSVPPAEAGFLFVGAHTDSPNLRLKPRPESESAGFRQLMVEMYGGVLLSTWLDRDLGLAGRVALKDGTAALVRLDAPLLRIPNLAIHLNREVNKEGLVLNPQQHLSVVAGLERMDASTLFEELRERLASSGHSGLVREDVLGFDLCLFDVQKGAFGGTNREFLFSARLDNLASCHAALTALLADRGEAKKTRGIALFDHEEVGSQSATGARARLLESVLERICDSYPSPERDAFARALSRSLLVSADMAHGVHPNYVDKHDRQHRPMLGGGPVIKVNANQAYATDGPGAAHFTRACRAVGVEPQHFVSRNDMSCGTTIGPIAAARLGVQTVDVGNPMLSMHSCREMASSADVSPMIRVLGELFVSEA